MATAGGAVVVLVSGPVEEEVDEALEIVDDCLPREGAGVAVLRRLARPYTFVTTFVRRDAGRDEPFTEDTGAGVGLS